MKNGSVVSMVAVGILAGAAIGYGSGYKGGYKAHIQDVKDSTLVSCRAYVPGGANPLVSDRIEGSFTAGRLDHLIETKARIVIQGYIVEDLELYDDTYFGTIYARPNGESTYKAVTILCEAEK